MKEETVLELFSTVQNGLNSIHHKLDDIQKSTDKRRELCYKQIEDKTSNTMFRWVIGIMVVTLLGVGGISTSTRIKVAETASEVEHIKKNIASIEYKLEAHAEKDVDIDERH